MSLTDALLLDPQKLDVWIALRTDSVKGSGTESDPFDGTPIQAKPIDVSTLTHSAREATVNTGGTSHGYLEGDVVTIAGVTGAGAPYYNGTFPIYSVTTLYWSRVSWRAGRCRDCGRGGRQSHL